MEELYESRPVRPTWLIIDPTWLEGSAFEVRVRATVRTRVRVRVRARARARARARVLRGSLWWAFRARVIPYLLAISSLFTPSSCYLLLAAAYVDDAAPAVTAHMHRRLLVRVRV